MFYSFPRIWVRRLFTIATFHYCYWMWFILFFILYYHQTWLPNIQVSVIPLTRSIPGGTCEVWRCLDLSTILSEQDPSQCLCPEQLSPLGSRSHINLRLLGKNWGAAGRNGIRERSRNRSSQLLHRIRAGWHWSSVSIKTSQQLTKEGGNAEVQPMIEVLFQQLYIWKLLLP